MKRPTLERSGGTDLMHHAEAKRPERAVVAAHREGVRRARRHLRSDGGPMAIRWQSVTIRGNQWQSATISGNPMAVRGNPWQSPAKPR